MKGPYKKKYDDVSLKTKLILTRSGSTFGTLRFVEKSVFSTFLGFISYWNYKPTNATLADRPGVYTVDKLFYRVQWIKFS